ncbi:hypothetical protein Pelo_6174 [Pelomyxa schiedti]|nr:hypothetical protein Pelo_6174 [Pelomyxa schiedti]
MRQEGGRTQRAEHSEEVEGQCRLGLWYNTAAKSSPLPYSAGIACFEMLPVSTVLGKWSSVKIGTIQRRLAWPLRKDDTQNREMHRGPTRTWAQVQEITVNKMIFMGTVCFVGDIILLLNHSMKTSTPLYANHDTCESLRFYYIFAPFRGALGGGFPDLTSPSYAFHGICSSGGTLVYITDASRLPEETFAYLQLPANHPKVLVINALRSRPTSPYNGTFRRAKNQPTAGIPCAHDP